LSYFARSQFIVNDILLWVHLIVNKFFVS